MSHPDNTQLVEDAKRQLDEILAREDPLKPRDRLAIPFQEIPSQTPEERIKLVYRIKIDVGNPDRELKLNMPSDAEILLE